MPELSRARSQRPTRPTGRAASLLAAAALTTFALLTAASPGLAQTSRSTASCAVQDAAAGKGAGRVSVERLSANGLSCGAARAIARRMATALALGRPISLAGAVSLDIVSATSCTGCAQQTQTRSTRPCGQAQLNVELRGGDSYGAEREPGMTIPGFPGFPGVPGRAAVPGRPRPVRPEEAAPALRSGGTIV